MVRRELRARSEGPGRCILPPLALVPISRGITLEGRGRNRLGDLHPRDTHMWTSPIPSALLLAVALGGCSDTASPEPGTFRAQLSGARVATLSGASNAERAFSEPFPELQYAIRMFDERGDTVRALVLRCLGDQPPLPGEYPLGTSGQPCAGTYARGVQTPEGGIMELEFAAASSGLLTIGQSQSGQIGGTFRFRGVLVVETDSVGTLEASGTFNADQL